VPANAGQPSHLAAAEVAASPEFADDFGPDGPPADPVAVNVLAPEDYAVLLHELGFVEQHVRLQVYPHVLGSTRDIVEWVKGTTLTRFKARLAPHRYDAFIAAYTTALLERVGDRSPCLFPFRRILLWARLPD
jgi:trans-aconitate 2-methyltransferase